jgi:hypothetical protein
MTSDDTADPDGSLRAAADRFWAIAAELPGSPRSLLLRPLDDSGKVRLGDPTADPYEIHGYPDDLLQVLSGKTLLIDAAYAGRVKILGTLPELSVLSGAGMDIQGGVWP